MPALKNARHERFAQLVAKGASQVEAYDAAGYEVKGESSRRGAATRLCANVSVAGRIKELLETAAERTIITMTQVMLDIEAIKQRCMQGEPVRDKEGNETGEWKFDARAALEACKLQGMYHGAWKNKTEHSGTVTLEELVCGGHGDEE